MSIYQNIVDAFFRERSSKIGEFMHIYPSLLEKIITSSLKLGTKIIILEIGNRTYETLATLLSLSDNIIVYGLDVCNNSEFNSEERKKLISRFGNRAMLLTGSQDDKLLLRQLCDHCKSQFGGFDLVIDDGSHKSTHVLTSFDIISECMQPEGVYVIEDIECMYNGVYPKPLTQEDYWLYPDKYRGLKLKNFITRLVHVVNRDFRRRAELSRYNNKSVPRRQAGTLGNYTLIGRDDLIASYRIYPNCLVMYFGYHITKPLSMGGVNPKTLRALH